MNKETMGNFIVQIRKEKGLTQKELAEQLHVTDKAVSKWERGNSFPDISLLEPLSEILEVSILELIEGQRVKEELTLTKEEAKEIVNQSISISDDEIKRKHIISKSTIIVISVLVLLLASIALNISNYQKEAAASSLSVDSDAYKMEKLDNGEDYFVDPDAALQQLLLDLNHAKVMQKGEK